MVLQAQLWGIAMRRLRLPSPRLWTFVQIAPQKVPVGRQAFVRE